MYIFLYFKNFSFIAIFKNKQKKKGRGEFWSEFFWMHIFADKPYVSTSNKSIPLVTWSEVWECKTAYKVLWKINVYCNLEDVLLKDV